MFFRRRHAQDTVVITPGRTQDDEPARRSTGGPIWNDRLGRWSIRSLQVLLVVMLGAIAVWGLLQVKVLVIAVLVAIILAAAAAPLIMWLRRRGLPPILAAWVTLLG